MATVGERIVAQAEMAELRRMRRRQQRAGRATSDEQALYDQQRRADLPAGHPFV